MRLVITAGLSLALLALTVGRAGAQQRVFKIERGSSHVQFVSDAPLERFTGKSSGVSGEIVVDPTQPGQGKGSVRVEVASIRTGIDLRDEHVRSDDWLDAARYPRIEFTITSVSGIAALTPNSAVEPTVRGNLSVHGITRPLSTKARVRYTPAHDGGERDSLRVQASFPVHLKDHGVSIPSIVALKVSPTLTINVDLRASAEPVATPTPTPSVTTTTSGANTEVEAAPSAVLTAPPASAAKAPSAPPRKAAKQPKPKAAQGKHGSNEPARAKPAASAAKAEAPPVPKAPQLTRAEAHEQLRSLLRKAHYFLAENEPARALRFVQKAQKLLPSLQSAE